MGLIVLLEDFVLRTDRVVVIKKPFGKIFVHLSSSVLVDVIFSVKEPFVCPRLVMKAVPLN